MTHVLENINQAEYDDIMQRYVREVGMPVWDKHKKTVTYPNKYISFYAGVQQELLAELQKRFAKVGCKLERIKHPFGKDGLYYKVIFKEEAFGLNIIDQVIVLGQMLTDIRLLDSHFGEQYPDIKMVIPEYRKARIAEVAELAFKKFLKMEKIININRYEEKRSNAAGGDSPRAER